MIERKDFDVERLWRMAEQQKKHIAMLEKENRILRNAQTAYMKVYAREEIL